MSKPLFKPPRHLVREWPEVFEDLYMNTMPIAYLDLIHLEFANGRVWEIDVRDRLKGNPLEVVANQVLDTLKEYRDEITKIDFKVDVSRLKKDISASTSSIL